jgi:hypothetical protein
LKLTLSGDIFDHAVSPPREERMLSRIISLFVALGSVAAVAGNLRIW